MDKNLDISIQTQQKFEFYFLALVFTVLGLSIQTSQFSSKLQLFFEVVAWISFLVSGLAGLSRMEWIPVSYKSYSELTEEKSFVREAKTGRPVKTESGILSDVEVKERIKHAENRIKERTQFMEEIEYRHNIKTFLHKWLFVAGLALLVLSRAVSLCYSSTGPGSLGTTQSTLSGDKAMTFTENLQIWTLVFTGLGGLAAVVAAGGVVYAAKTFRFNTWLKAQAIYTDAEFGEARGTVFSYFGFDKENPPTFDGREKDHALLVCRRMDELARLKWYVGKEKIIEVWGHQMGKSWIILEKLVDNVRIEDGFEKKWKAFEDTAKEAIEKYNLKK